MNDAARIPVSTYRLQLSGTFGFAAASEVVDYLARLGTTDCYLSPYLKARPASPHGYDICDHNLLNPELGTDEEYRAFVEKLQARSMGQLLDFVPNHMSVDPRTNPWWRDVMENGPSSPFARFFDIDWEPVTGLERKVLLPILGDQYGQVLERGELRLRFEDGLLHLLYTDHDLPINPRQAPTVYRHGVEGLKSELGEEDASLREFLSVIAALSNMPPYTETDQERIAERQREKEVSRERLMRLIERAPPIGNHIDRAVTVFNGEPGNPSTFDLLHDLLEAQAYRLAYWRTASHEINYRRFFDINDLAGLRMEDPEVFGKTHVLVLRLAAEGAVTGLRIDHPDGLYDPGLYFTSLQRALSEVGASTPDRPFYVVAEKILSASERLPERWTVHGTTGYNFLNDLNALFVHPEGLRGLAKVYARFADRTLIFADVLYESKKLIMDTAMASELNVLAHELSRIAQSNRRSRDFTLNSLRDVLMEIVACFPVYRTYASPEGWELEDRQTIETAVSRARRRNPAMEPSIFDFLREVLLPRRPDQPTRDEDTGAQDERRRGYGPADEAEVRRRVAFAMKFQQYTGPVQAKGLEDTAFYRHNLLLSLNEVGGDPGRPVCTAIEFHASCQSRLAEWPLEMLPTSTHDSKLGEDVRARLNAISELPEDWRRELYRWARINASNRTIVHNEPAPDRNDEYRFYQTLVGIWPADLIEPAVPPNQAPAALIERLREHMMKAIREAKTHTSWINQDRAYDEAVARFVDRSLGGPTSRLFLAALVPFLARIAPLGMVNSLAQVVLKIACPGVADFYQGTELWNLTLVDPDNRQPVDFRLRCRLLEELAPLIDGIERAFGRGSVQSAPESLADEVGRLAAHWNDGRIKLLVTACGLRFRRSHPDLFLRGAYLPLITSPTGAGDVVACARRRGRDAVVAIVPRHVAYLPRPIHGLPLGPDSWSTSRVLLPLDFPPGPYRDLFTGEAVRSMRHKTEMWVFVGEALRVCPVALLYARSE